MQVSEVVKSVCLNFNNMVRFLFLVFLLASCSPQFHLNKFYKKGGKLECDTTTIYKLDTIIKDGDTIILERPFTIIEKQIEYKTRWQTRYEYKYHRDTLRVYRDKIKYKYKIVKKEQRTEAKNKPIKYFNRILAILILVLAIILSFYLNKKFK